MKKQEVTSLIFWIAVFGGYIAYFFLMIQPFYAKGYSGYNDWFAYFFTFILVILVSIIFTAVFLELFHLLGAKIGGYKVISLNILGFNFYRDDNKIRFRFAKFDGLTGETKIIPNTKKEKEANPSWYIFLNSFFFVIEFTALYFVFYYFKDNTSYVLKNVARAALTFGLTSGVIWLYNLLPVQMENMTDGYRFFMSKGKEKRKEFNKKLLESYTDIASVTEQQENKEEKEEVVIPSDNSIDSIYAYLILKQKDKALEVCENILNDKSFHKRVLEVKCLRFYIQVIDSPLDEGKALYDKDFSLNERRDISQENELPFIEAYVLMAGLFDKSRSECDRVLQRVAKAYKHAANNKKKIEQEIVNSVIDRVLSAHPNWELEKYKITSIE